MADGRTHENDSTAVAIPLGLLIAGATAEIPLGVAAGFGCLCGIFLTPDLDVDTFTRSKRKAVNASPLGWLWVGFWYPYAKAIKHRAWVSHLPLIGTLIRVVYLFLLPLLIMGYMQMNGVDIYGSAVILKPLLLPLASSWFLGLCVSDLIHWVRDGSPIVLQPPQN